jgi:serine/threonine protein kinase
VSDFGLTKFREEFKRTDNKELQGSVHWTAPEILNEVMDADLMEADVYSFGIILWELCTRQQPYMGMRYTNTSERDSSLRNRSLLTPLSATIQARPRWRWR